MHRFSRRDFLVAGAGVLATTAAPRILSSSAVAAPNARYTRYSVTSPEGQKMLASYAKGVQAMLDLPADHPLNWFRYAFIHMMDCPHGNWWFYVWHRGYIGYFEQIIRRLSGDPEFALPFWDWTETPEIPAGMFRDVLTPSASAYLPYTQNLQQFSDLIKTPLYDYWQTLTPSQRRQQQQRGYPEFDDLWNSVVGYDTDAQGAIAGNMAYVNTLGARYLTPANPALDPKTAFDVSPLVVSFGLIPETFYEEDNWLSFASSKTASHTVQPNGTTKFSVLEGFPHNKVHNYIGGVGPVDPGPYGNMTNFLSPVDPIFFLHHANMDRLWDIWERQQLAAGRNPQPTTDQALYNNEPFQFYVDSNGEYVGAAKAQDYLSTRLFDYNYGPGFGDRIRPLKSTGKAPVMATKQATVTANMASVEVPANAIQAHQSGTTQLAVEVVVPKPLGFSSEREYDILVNAPDEVTHVLADSPYYAGTIAFFGPPMKGMKMAPNASFHVVLPTTLSVLKDAADSGAPATINIRVVSSRGRDTAPPKLSTLLLKAVP